MLPQQELRLVGCLIVAIPICYIMTYIKKSLHILLYIVIFSIILQVVVYGKYIVVIWIQQHIVYGICKYGRRKDVGKVVFLETFFGLTAVQITRMYFSYGIQNVDITAIFMMQVFQYVGFAYNYQDGELKQQATSPLVIKQLPSYLEYVGFVQFIPSCLVGPVFEFTDFQAYVQRKGIFEDVTPGFSIFGIKKELKTTVFCAAVFFCLIPFPVSFMLTDKFVQYSIFFQMLYLLVSMIGVRFKYYLAWSLGMMGMNATGITYNPITTKQGKIENKWNRIIVSNIWDFQIDPSMKKKVDGWNISVQMALKKYIYDRIMRAAESSNAHERKKTQIIAQQKTIAVTAIWHGLYPGYFLAFFHWTLILQISQELFRIQKQSGNLKKLRNKLKYLEIFVINYFLDYVAVSFVVLTWEKNKMFFSATYCVPLVIIYIMNLLIVRLAIFSTKTTRQKGGEQVVDKPANQKSA